ncbi:MAG: DUF4234 domain-containing protein [Defluviitaleaceae bacterium]|nr:DUF4234 domain-containing protein [Defluviitaleaceae bacterium]
MLCTACGSPNNESAVFCENCGTKMESIETATNSEVEVPSEEDNIDAPLVYEQPTNEQAEATETTEAVETVEVMEAVEITPPEILSVEVTPPSQPEVPLVDVASPPSEVLPVEIVPPPPPPMEIAQAEAVEMEISVVDTPLPNSTERTSESTAKEESPARKGVMTIGPITIDATNEDGAFMRFGTREVKARLIFLVLSGMLAFMFFMPIFRIPVDWWNFRWIMGVTAFFGARGGSRGAYGAIFILIFPVLVGLLFYFKTQVQSQVLFIKNNLYVFATGGYVLGFFAMLLSRGTVRGVYGSLAGGTIFFWFFLLCYLIVIAFTALFMLSSKGIGFNVDLSPKPVPIPPVPMGGESPHAQQASHTGANMNNGAQYASGEAVYGSVVNNYIGVQRSGIEVLLLTIVTCGIYGIYWYYTVIQDINSAAGEERVSVVMLVLGIFCFPVYWVMLYQIDSNLARLARENGTHYKENFILWLLLSFVAGVGGIVAMFQICGGLNDLWTKRAWTMYNNQG